MFTGWLLGSAVLHAVALAAIPSTPQLEEGPGGAESVQVLLRGGNALRDVAIQTLTETPGLQTPTTIFPATDVVFDTSTLTNPVSESQPHNEVAFSSLDEAFEKDAQVLASLREFGGILLVDDWRDPLFTPPLLSLTAPGAGTSGQRSDLEPVASLDTVVPSQVTPTTGSSRELPVPIAKPGDVAQPGQPQELASATGSTGGEAASNEKSTAGLTTDVVTADMSTLIALLHDEIARHKRYPALAKRQHREGTATVSFALYPDGAIEEINVISSSGFGRLDKAALFAVSEAAPFLAAQSFIDQARHFKVNIVFSLQ